MALTNLIIYRLTITNIYRYSLANFQIRFPRCIFYAFVVAQIGAKIFMTALHFIEHQQRNIQIAMLFFKSLIFPNIQLIPVSFLPCVCVSNWREKTQPGKKIL